MTAMHEIDYKIFGDDMQFVEVELDPQEAAIAEAAAPCSNAPLNQSPSSFTLRLAIGASDEASANNFGA